MYGKHISAHTDSAPKKRLSYTFMQLQTVPSCLFLGGGGGGAQKIQNKKTKKKRKGIIHMLVTENKSKI